MKRSKFSLSHRKLLSCDLGELLPIGLVEVLPGDSIQQATSALVRASPLLSPVMHPVDVRIHHWYVPHRLTWSSWEDFITGGPDGLNASVFPTITGPGGGGIAIGSLADYFGVPTGVASLVTSALPFRAYGLVWNEYYRDQDLETALVVSKADGNDTTTNTTLQNCDWEKDYFTSSRPWEQKGPAVTVPVGGEAPLKGLGVSTLSATPGASGTLKETGSLPDRAYPFSISGSSVTGWSLEMATGSTTSKPKLVADLSLATGVNVNQFRAAMAMQRWEEMRARFGSRYPEYLAALGVRSSDGRLQRPEYLGGGRDTIQFSEVLQTGPGSDPVGAMKGHGIAAMRSNRYRRFFEEHGYVISLLSMRPKTMYIQGLPRTWNRRTKDEFWQPEFQHIGQQKIKKKEVYAGSADPEGTFGYQDRYDEYRRQESWVSGEFRTTLNHWHFARSFGAEPSLNATFVKCVPPETPFAANTSDTMWVMVKHSIQARRLVAQSGKSFIL